MQVNERRERTRSDSTATPSSSHEKFGRGADGDANYRTDGVGKGMWLGGACENERDRESRRFDFSLFQARSCENGPWPVMKAEGSQDPIFRSRSIYPLFVPRKIPTIT